MKVKLVVLIAIELLLVLLISLLIVKNNQESRLIDRKLAGPPALYVKNGLIKRADTDDYIQLKGVSTLAFSDNNYDINGFVKVLNKMKSWKINLLGLYVNPNNLKIQEDKLDTVIEWAKKNNVYVYLMPKTSVYYGQKVVLSEMVDFPLFMNQLAKKYAHYNHVIYGLWVEPHYISWEDWRKLAVSIIDSIIKEKPNALIIGTGIDSGRTFDFNDLFHYENIIYDFHFYPAANIKELSRVLIKNQKLPWSPMINQHPILVGEFGGVWESDFNSQEDLNYTQVILNEINLHSLHYTAFTIDKDDQLRLIDWSTDLPTKRGQIIKNDLINHPPTDFNQ